MDQRSKYKEQNYKTVRRKHKSFLPSVKQWFLRYEPKAQATKEKLNQNS